ncbi:MAG: 2-C-methyl-D-erythritol 4-phosphate cytidylyltransferase [Petroclostridium sp.]|uniref:2-C-methyl-D-erythritol 4-phosphate cytidylyltransferase n=1 Tax=Petroclostridium xylanilyticum TaxID=1792311 RepID=UPI00311A057E|nr:2-C-methyl-D-erythritol 4-phosphate cytidylyltransferase [Clostridia bacterium]MDK2809735.1 2-C-methyl-D-erythritol 4-phosphate cytidylyltransferase [Petroclostridium sp.]
MLDIFKNFFKEHKMNKNKEYCSAIIVAAGKGSRMNASKNKQFINIIDRPVLAYTLQAFEDCELIDEIVVVTRQEDIMACKEIIDMSELVKVKKIVVGGKERQDSVYNGLKEISNEATIVAIHDGARPLILPKHIEEAIEAAVQYNAAAVGVRVKDTIKLVDDNNNIVNTLDRSKLWAVQTPQVFKVEILKRAHQKAIEEGISATDDCMLVEQMGYQVKMVEGSYENIKITTPEDIFLAEAIISGRELEEDEYE